MLKPKQMNHPQRERERRTRTVAGTEHLEQETQVADALSRASASALVVLAPELATFCRHREGPADVVERDDHLPELATLGPGDVAYGLFVEKKGRICSEMRSF